MRLGDFELTRISGGRFRLDGGAMFGVVPKPLWNRVAPADEANRVQLDTNCIVIKTKDELVLIDSGYGDKQSDKERQQLAIEQPLNLSANLLAKGIQPADISLVIPSHLHFDHASGLTVATSNGTLAPTFPNAKIVVQRDEWQAALGGAPELAGNYPVDELRALNEAGCFYPVEGAYEVTPGIRLSPTGGHTRGHQMIHISSQGEEAVYLGDVCPTSAHLKTFWTMAYDLFPLEVRQLKPQLLKKAVERQQWILFDHDPETPAAKLAVDPNGNLRIAEALRRNQF